MRLYPPIASILREALHDLEIDGYLVPKGSAVMVSPYVLHRTAAYFPDPETFDPDRFTPEREKQFPRCAYLPFGAGPRICIGNHLALMEGHLLIATLAQRVHFQLVPGQTIAPDPVHNLALRPGGKWKWWSRRESLRMREAVPSSESNDASPLSRGLSRAGLAIVCLVEEQHQGLGVQEGG
jgi:cytochrome P450